MINNVTQTQRGPVWNRLNSQGNEKHGIKNVRKKMFLKRLFRWFATLIMLLAVFAASAAYSAPAVAAPPQPTVTGSFQWDFRDSEEGTYAWGGINIHETSSGKLEGRMWMKETKTVDGLYGMIRWEAQPICWHFYEYEGNPAVAVFGQFTGVRKPTPDFWPGEVGQYWWSFWVDGGTPGAEGDLVGTVWTSLGWPRSDIDPEVECDNEEFTSWYGWYGASAGGNLVIHGAP